MWAEQAAQELDAELIWRPFELHPETPPEGQPKPFPPEQWPAVRQRLIDLASVVGLSIEPPQRNVNSHMALEIGELVREAKGDAAMARFHHAVSRAFFVEGADISQRDVIAPLAAAEGIERAALDAAWDEMCYADAIERSMYDSYRAGVAGVPAFGWEGEQAMSGMREAHELATLLRERASREPR